MQQGDAQRGAPMGHIALRPQQARELLTLMHATFSCEVGEERQAFAVGKGELMVPVAHFWRSEQRNLQGTHANFPISGRCALVLRNIFTHLVGIFTYYVQYS